MLINKSIQVAAFADDINIMGRSYAVVEEAYIDLKRKVKTVGLHITTNKTKIMAQTGRNIGRGWKWSHINT